MRRYLVFGGDWYYPSGGFNDYVADFDDEAAAIAHAKAFVEPREHRHMDKDWAHVLDTQSGALVWDGERKPRI